jgi:hypothetical protein
MMTPFPQFRLTKNVDHFIVAILMGGIQRQVAADTGWKPVSRWASSRRLGGKMRRFPRHPWGAGLILPLLFQEQRARALAALQRGSISFASGRRQSLRVL